MAWWLGRLPAWMRCQGARACLLRIFALSAAGFVVTLVVTLLCGQVTPTTVLTLAPQTIRHDSASCYKVRVAQRAFFPWAAPSDWSGAEGRSTLVLFEDGRPLNPAHQAHERIRSEGGRGYSHWGKQLLFSTSDGSDPRTNGRRYHVEQRWQLHPALPALALWFGAIAAVSSLLLSVFTGAAGPALGRYAALWLAGLMATAVLVIHLAAPTVHAPLAKTAIRATDGQGWGVVIGPLVQFPFAVPGDSLRWPVRSGLTLAEDGQPLGPAHSAHSAINSSGGGFSHWGESLLFSTSDGSDPRANGRVYRYSARAGVAPSLSWLLLAVLTATALVYVNRLTPAARWFLARGTGIRSGLPSLWPVGLVVGSIALALSLTLGKWEWAQTTTLNAAGYLPLSDAHAYWNCAKQIAADGVVTELADVCAGRIVYPAMLASLIALSNWQPHLVYLLQAMLVAIAIAALALQAARLSGAIGGILVAVFLMLFAAEHAFGTTMTEVAGFVAGNAALALLLFGAEGRRPWAVLVGLGLLAVALVARAGAMFILPALLLWVVLVAPALGLRRRRAAVAAAGALVAGALLQFTLVAGLRVDGAATFGNFSTVLYGLASGGKGWSHVYEAHPEVFAAAFANSDAGAIVGQRSALAAPGELAAAYQRVYKLAFARIYAEPEVFVSALIRQIQSFWHWYFDLRLLPTGSWPALKGLVLLGLLYCLWHWRSPAGALMLAWALAETASAALLPDGGMRIFAASVGNRFVLAALGLSALLRLPLRVFAGPAPTGLAGDASARLPVSVLAAAAGGSVVVLALLPVLHLLPFGRLAQLPAHQCPDDQVAVVTRVDRESPSLTLVGADGATGWYPLRVQAGQLVAGMDHTWFGQDFAAIPVGTTLVSGTNRVTPGATVAIAVADAPDWFRPGVTIGACADPRQWLPVAGRRYHKVTSLVRLSVP